MEYKVCPFCGEKIAAAAKKCRFCDEWLDESVRPTTVPLPVKSEAEEKVDDDNSHGFFERYWKCTFVNRYVAFDGVEALKDFWLSVVAYYVVLLGITGLGALIGSFISPLAAMGGMFIASGLYQLATLVPLLALTVRRLRDAGKPWTMIFVSLIPLAGPIWLLLLLCRKGQDNGNDNCKFKPLDWGVCVGSGVLFVAGMVMTAISFGSYTDDSADETYSGDGSLLLRDSYDGSDWTAEEGDEAVFEDYEYRGTIHDYDMVMNLEVYDDQISGSWYYVAQSSKSARPLEGQISSGQVVLYELDDEGDKSGRFDLELDSRGALTGQYTILCSRVTYDVYLR